MSSFEDSLTVLSSWSPEEVPVLDLRDEEDFLSRRFPMSYNIPMDELHCRMFCLPPPSAPLAVLLPSVDRFHLVTSDPSSSQSHHTGLKKQMVSTSTASTSEPTAAVDVACSLNLPHPSSTQCPRNCSRPVYLKGFSSIKDFLATRGGVAASWVLEDSPQVWQAAAKLSLDEAAAERSLSSSPSDAAGAGPLPEAAGEDRGPGRGRLRERLRRRFLFKPCPLLERWIETIERELVERELAMQRCSGARREIGRPQTDALPSDADGVADPGPVGTSRGDAAAGPPPTQPSSVDGPPRGTPPLEPASRGESCGSPRRHALRLRALEPGCGSGRNLAWLAARETSVRLTDGSWVDISWDVVGLDFWYGALVRIQDLCQLAAFTPRQVALYHCEVVEGSVVPLPPPKSSCKHAATPRVHIQDLPLPTAAASSASTPGGAAAASSASTPGGAAGQHSADESTGDGCRPLLPGLEPFDVILCVRFLHRALNDRVHATLSRGGYVLYNTFLDLPGTQAFGRPKGGQHLLQAGELERTWFGDRKGFRVLCDEVEVEPQSGRELSLFLARLGS